MVVGALQTNVNHRILNRIATGFFCNHSLYFHGRFKLQSFVLPLIAYRNIISYLGGGELACRYFKQELFPG